MLGIVLARPRPGLVRSVNARVAGTRFLSATGPIDQDSKSGEASAAATETPASRGTPGVKDKPLPWYYAVRKGREVGVFEDWEEAKGKVLGFSGAIFKPFRSAERARKWLELDVSQIDPKDLPAPPKKAEEKDTVLPSSYELKFGSVISTSEDPEKKGLVGIGWILRKQPERTMVLAGCDLFDIKAWKAAHPKRVGYEPQLPRELPLLESLNRALDETKKAFKIDEASKATEKSEGKSESGELKLPFPLHIQSDHVYTVGLLSGANPVLPELVEPLKSAQDKIKAIAGSYAVEEVSFKENTLAQGLAKAAIARKNPKVTITGGKFVPSFNSLMRILNNTPDLPSNFRPADPPSGPLTINGEEVKHYRDVKKQAA